MKTSLPRSLW